MLEAAFLVRIPEPPRPTPYHSGSETLNTPPRPSAVTMISVLITATQLACVTPVLASKRAELEPPSALFVASDFPRLARGLDAGFSGEAAVHVWAPAQDQWSLTEKDGTLAISLKSKSGDPTPGWQVLGKVTIPASRMVRVVVAANAPPSGGDSPSSDPVAKKSTAKDKAGKPNNDQPNQTLQAPAFLWFSSAKDSTIHPGLDLIRGRIDTIEPTDDQRRGHIRTNRQGVDFQAPATSSAWHDRAHHLREQLRVTLGLWPMFPKSPLNPQVYGRLDRGDYTIEKVVLETMPGFTLSGNLYRPAHARDKVPGILCPHGHWSDGRVNPEVQQRCIRWAKLGCVVFLYDMVGYNDSKPFTHEFLNDRLKRWGLSLPTLQTWNSIRALDWLTALPDVDSARIGCTGESGGGTQTFLLTALDDRVKVSAPVVMVSENFQGGCVCENAAGLRFGTDNVEFAALCAPRPLVLVGATGDWTSNTMTRSYPAIRGVYTLIGSTDRIKAQIFDFPHNYNETSRNAVYADMGRWLLGIDNPEKTKEGKQQPEKPEDLLTFDSSHPAPSERRTPAQLEEYLLASLGRTLDDLAPSAGPLHWEAARRSLFTSLKIRVGLTNPAPEQIADHEVRRVSLEDKTVIHSTIGRRVTGEAIPVVQLIPAHTSGRLTIIAGPGGKTAVANGSGQPDALTTALLARGHIVIGFDPLFVGESLDPRHPAAGRPKTDHFETYNPVTAADQMQDLATVLAWSKALPDVREVNLVAKGLSGVQLLLARPALTGLSRTVLDVEEAPDPQEAGALPAAIDLPGMFQFGGPKAAAALTAPAPLWLCRGARNFDLSWAKAAYAQSDAGSMLRTEPAAPDSDQVAAWIDQGQ
jgi:hypothetical protein